MSLSKTRKHSRRHRSYRVQKNHRSLRHLKQKHMRKTRSKRGGGLASDQRQALVNFWRRNQKAEYEALTNQILSSPHERDSLFNYFDEWMRPGPKSKGFSPDTLMALYYFLHRAQEEAVPESWRDIPYVYEQVARAAGHRGDKQTLQVEGQKITSEELARWQTETATKRSRRMTTETQTPFQ